jgi:hypothetical protein
MGMRSVEPLEEIKFFNQLSADDEFCKYLGKVVLATGRLEAEPIRFMSNSDINENVRKANLGKLIRFAKSGSAKSGSEHRFC